MEKQFPEVTENSLYDKLWNHLVKSELRDFGLTIVFITPPSRRQMFMGFCKQFVFFSQVTLPATVPTHHPSSFPPGPAPGPYPGVPLTQPMPRWDPLRDSEGYVKDPLAAFEAAMMKKDHRRYKRSRSRSPPPAHYPRRYSPLQRVYR